MFGFSFSQQPHPEEEVIDLVDAEVGGHEILFQLSYYNNHLIIKFNILRVAVSLWQHAIETALFIFWRCVPVTEKWGGAKEFWGEKVGRYGILCVPLHAKSYSVFFHRSQ